MSDITGMRFGRLTAVRPTDMRSGGFIVWECKCDCGATAFVKRGALISGNTRSCGCLLRETAGKMRKAEWLKPGADTQDTAQKEHGKVSRNNTSGYRGVAYRASRDKYVAEIGFQWKVYYLGSYKNLEDAVEVRRKAETLILDEGEHFYQRWKNRAEAEPEWAKANPVRFRVTKTDGEGYTVVFSPVFIEDETDKQIEKM